MPFILKKLLVASLVITISQSTGLASQAIDARLQDSLKSDWPGETLQEYRSRYPRAVCSRTDGGHGEKAREGWSHCTVRDGIAIGPYPLASSISPAYPFGATASFYQGELVGLTYVLAAPSVWAVTAMITDAWGSPDWLWTESGESAMAGYWSKKEVSASIERIPVRFGADADGTIISHTASAGSVIMVRVIRGRGSPGEERSAAEEFWYRNACPVLPTGARRDLSRPEAASLDLVLRNQSPKTISGIRLDVWFLDGVGQILEEGAILSFVTKSELPPGETRKYTAAVDWKRANEPRVRGTWVRVSRVLYDDGSSWDSPDGVECRRDFMDTLTPSSP